MAFRPPRSWNSPTSLYRKPARTCVTASSFHAPRAVLPCRFAHGTAGRGDPNPRALELSRYVPISGREFLSKGLEVGAKGSKFDQLFPPGVISNGLELGCNLFGLGAETCNQNIDKCAKLGFAGSFAGSFAGPLSLEFLKYR